MTYLTACHARRDTCALDRQIVPLAPPAPIKVTHLRRNVTIVSLENTSLFLAKIRAMSAPPASSALRGQHPPYPVVVSPFSVLLALQ